MPLDATNLRGVPDDSRKAIGFWMTSQGEPVDQIRVFVTYEALWQTDTSTVRDVAAAIGLFDKNRTRIESTASNKLDTKGVDEGTYEGQPILYIRSSDIDAVAQDAA
jgi:hypothetical protein